MTAGLIVLFVVLGATLAIAIHQLWLVRSDRIYLPATLWSAWSAAVIGAFIVLHLPHSPLAISLGSMALATVIALVVPMGMVLAHALRTSPTADPHSRTWVLAGFAFALIPAVLQLTLTQTTRYVDDPVTGPMQMRSMGTAGVVPLLLSVPFVVRALRWNLWSRSVRSRAAQVVTVVLAASATHDVVVLTTGADWVLVLPYAAAAQAFFLQHLLAVESRDALLQRETSALATQAADNLRTILVGLPDAVVVHDGDRIRLVNPAAERLVGAVSGAPIAPLFAGTDIDPRVATALGRDRAVEGPVAVPLADGRTGEVLARSIRYGALPATMLLIRDVTEQRQLQEQLLQADRLKSLGTLAAGVAHEINNPLAYVVGNLEAARLAVRGGPEERADLGPMLDDAHDGAVRIQRIVSDLRAFASPGRDGDRFEVAAAIDDALRLVRRSVELQSTLTVELGPTPPVRGDRGRFSQVVVDLVGNAVHAVAARDHGGHVTIRTSTTADGAARVEVIDDGVGMTAEVAARALDPFFTTRQVGAGVGLGLSVCHGVVRSMGGQIALRSQLGAGTTVELTLPGVAPVIASPPAPAPAPATAASARILVIDDDVRLAKSIARMLSNHVVAVATTAAAIEERLADGPYQLVLCDLMMPELSGMELHARLVDQSPALADAMLFMTGGAFTDEAIAFVARFPDRCLDKPFSQATLRAAVATRLGAIGPAAPPPEAAPAVT